MKLHKWSDIKAERFSSDLDAIIRRSGNPTAIAELERLRRVQRSACALVESWKHGGPDDMQRGRISAELEAAVEWLMGAERAGRGEPLG